MIVTTAPWWVRPGLEVGRRAVAHRRRGRRGARARARDAALRLRPRRGSPRTPGRDRRRFAPSRRPLPAPLRAEGQPRARGPGGPARARRAGRRPEPSASTPARPARSCAPSTAAGAPTRSATPGRTSRSATSTSCSPTAVHLTSMRSARSSGSGGGRRVAARSGSGSTPAPAPATTRTLTYSGGRPTKFGICRTGSTRPRRRRRGTP